jgi:hypothetical protein
VAKLGTNHHWDSGDLHLVVLEKGLFRDYWGDSSSLVLFSVLDFLDFDSAEEFCLVCEASDSGFMGEDVVVQAVTFMLARMLIDCDPAEDNLVSGLFVVGAVVLSFNLDFVLTELFDNFLDRVLQKALE